MRREIVEAVQSVPIARVTELGMSTRQVRITDAEAESIARAVLRAALTGDEKGEWTAVRSARLGSPWWTICRLSETDDVAFFKWQALAVANALNLSRDLAVGE